MAGLCLRLGFRQIKGVAEEEADWIAGARGNGYLTVEDVWRRAGVHRRPPLTRLAEADCFAVWGSTAARLCGPRARWPRGRNCRCLRAIWMAKGSWSPP